MIRRTVPLADREHFSFLPPRSSEAKGSGSSGKVVIVPEQSCPFQLLMCGSRSIFILLNSGHD